MAERLKGSDYKETLGVDYTSSIRVEISGGLQREAILQRLAEHVLKANDPYLPAIGAILGTGEPSKRAGVIFGLHPSQKYGTPKAEDNETFVRHIAEAEDWQVAEEALPALRIPLGRRRGYNPASGEVPTVEVRTQLRRRGREALRYTVADLFSIRFNPEAPDKISEYHEPGVLIDASQKDLETEVIEDIKQVAALTQQDMFVASITGVRTQVYRQPQEKDA